MSAESGPIEPTQLSRNALHELVVWSENLPLWQRDALRRICQQEELSQSDLDELTLLCRNQHVTPDGDDKSTVAPLTLSHVRSSTVGRKTAIRCIKDATHVNALADGQVLTFREDGLTIVYGGNGSGKSGYARILKRACRAREASGPVLPNVYVLSPGNCASAIIEYSVDGARKSTKWADGKATDDALSAISVFDARCASVHVEGTNDVAYTPRALGVLASLAGACREVKRRLTAERETVQAVVHLSLAAPSCRPHTKVAQRVDALNAATDIKIFEELAEVTDDERKRLENLRADLAQDPQRLAQQLRLRKERLLQAISKIQSLDGAVSARAADDLRQLLADSAAKAEAARVAATQLFEGEPLPGIGSATWRALWEAARKYSEAEVYVERIFPVTDAGARCVLCQQTLESDAVTRLTRFETFVRENTQVAATEAAKVLEAARHRVRDSRLTGQERTDWLGQVRDELGDSSLAGDLRHYLVIGCWRRRQLLRVMNPETWPTMPELPDSPITELRRLADGIDNRIGELLNATNAEARRCLELDLHELEDRLWLSSVLEDLRREIERRKKLAAINSAIADTDTTSITTRSTSLAKRLVTRALRDRFAKEVSRVGVTDLRIELVQTTSQYGVPRFRVSLIASPSTEVGAVLSEGEYRCIALAAFLSELATTDDYSGIVFDDPVSSLDHEHRQAVAKRLVEESLLRQVIVFTHDVVFLTYLAEDARLADIDPAYRSVSRGPDETGFCSCEPPLKVRPVLDALACKEEHLLNVSNAYTRGEADRWTREVKSIAGELRELWERAVEQALSPVFYRFDHKVDTKGLVRVTVLNETDCQVMRYAFGRCSKLQHSEPAEVNSPMPTPNDMQKEIEVLRDWMTSLLQRQDAVKPI